MPRSLGFNLSSDSTSKVGKKAPCSDQVTAVSSNTNDTIWTNFFWGWLSIWAKEGFKVQSSHYLGRRWGWGEKGRCWSYKFSRLCKECLHVERAIFVHMLVPTSLCLPKVKHSINHQPNDALRNLLHTG